MTGPTTLAASLPAESELGSGVQSVRDITFTRGAGATLWDADGRAFIDCTAAYGVASLGHAHPAITATIRAQSEKLIACSATYGNDQRAAYMRELTDAFPGDLGRLFFCNSGTEAVEAALKFARFSTGRQNVIACKRAFHGRTMGALAVTWDRRYRETFGQPVPGTTHVAFDDAGALERALDGDVAAVVIEPVQGEGGVHPASPEYLRAARELCERHGALLIFDEVQTGFGRMGELFACQHAGVVPDILCLAKGIAAGFPMGAVALGARVRALTAGMHGSTFGGNPLACAVARTTLEVLRAEQLPQRAARLGAGVLARLEAARLPQVRAVRGLGLMIGIELRQRNGPALAALLERGIVLLAAGTTVIRLLPPLTIAEEQLDRALTAIEDVLQ